MDLLQHAALVKDLLPTVLEGSKGLGLVSMWGYKYVNPKMGLVSKNAMHNLLTKSPRPVKAFPFPDMFLSPNDIIFLALSLSKHAWSLLDPWISGIFPQTRTPKIQCQCS